MTDSQWLTSEWSQLDTYVGNRHALEHIGPGHLMNNLNPRYTMIFLAFAL
jgi:hypothetical protein